MITLESVLTWLATGENERLEFKEKYTSRAIESLIAFANTGGGQVLLGVDSQGRVVGLTDPNKVIEAVTAACREAVSPPLAPLVEHVSLPQGIVVVAQVPATGRMHAKGGTVFVRHGRQTRKASADEIRALALAETPEVYEMQPAAGAHWDDLELARITEYFRSVAPRAESIEASVSDLAAGAGFLVIQAGQRVPTVAGLVLFGREPQRYNASWGITALRIRGREMNRNRVVDRRELTGAADALIEAGLRFVTDHMHIGYRFENGRRIEVPEYPLEAVRETLANAVAHREYHPAEPCQLRLFDDRLEVQNPGGLLPGLTLEAVLRGGVTRRRNERIAEVLRQKGYVEKAGFGLVFIQQQMRQVGLEPQFEASTTHFLTLLPAHTMPAEQ